MNAGLRSAALALFTMLLPQTAAAQVQRSFFNLSFEQPALQTTGCRVYIAASQVPGWNTTHPATPTENVGGCVVPAGFAQTAPILELWRTPRDSASGGPVIARSGTQIAELNAVVASRIFQNICLINGGRVNWRFSHRGRGSATTRDLMVMKVGATSTVVQVGTTNSGASDTPVVSQGTVNAPANAPGNPTWVDYSGVFTYAGPTGTTNVGFEALNGTTSGNLLDDIQIDLVPFVEFTQPSSSSPESTGGNLPTLRVNGTTATPITINVQITGGTATLGTDYTTPGNSTLLSVVVPAGTYDGVGAASLIALPITVVNDSVPEPNETILFGIVAPPPTNPPFQLASSTTCGGPVQTTWTYTIVDDDAGVALSKNAAAPVAVAGNSAQADVVYTVAVSNPSATVAASYGLVDTPGFDPDVSIVSANFRLNGGAATALAGSGPWTLQPPGRVLAAAATDTYIVSVRVNVNRGGSVGNDACASPSAAGSGLHNAARATVPGSGGAPATVLDASACGNTPTPVWATLRKQLTGRVAATDQIQVRLLSGGIVTSSATTTGSTVPATASTGLVVLPAGNTLQFEEAVKTSGTGADRPLTGYRPQIVCSNAGTASAGVPSGPGSALGDRQQWPEFTPAAGADLDCTISNAVATADLGITKTDNATTVVSGSEVSYAIVVANAGPDAANGAIVRDTVTSGLTCTTATCSNPVNGATCPAATGAVLLAALQSAGGVAIPVLPNTGTVTFTVTCTVQ